MSRIFIGKMGLMAFLVSFACGTGFAQQFARGASSQPVVPYQDMSAPGAPDLIFSNLDPTPGARFNNQFAGFPIAGSSAIGVTESAGAILFIPRVDTRAKVLSAAIVYISGTKLVNLGIYSSNVDGGVGAPLPGAQGSTTQIPNAGVCCQLAKVVLPSEGVLLSKGTIYWLVASPDDVRAPDFRGSWDLSNLPHYASYVPGFPWQTYPGQWLAAQIAGTDVQPHDSEKAARMAITSSPADASGGKPTIFANLASSSIGRYDAFNGLAIRAGDEWGSGCKS